MQGVPTIQEQTDDYERQRNTFSEERRNFWNYLFVCLFYSSIHIEKAVHNSVLQP